MTTKKTTPTTGPVKAVSVKQPPPAKPPTSTLKASADEPDNPPPNPPGNDIPPKTGSAPPPATVRKAGDWYLVTYGQWQASVAPDGLVMLPRHLHPEDLAEFAGCIQVACDVATKLIEDNKTSADTLKAAPRSLMATRQAIVTQGGVPQGAVRMRTVSAQQRAASIGRGKRRDATRTPTPRGGTQ